MPRIQRRVSVFDEDDVYFDTYHTRDACLNYAHRCILPVNRILQRAVAETGQRFCFNLCISGLLCDLLEQFEPVALESFRALVATGNVELIATPYHQGLAFIYDSQEFADQLMLHGQRMEGLFNRSPVVFGNSELIHQDRIAELVAESGYDVILCDGGHAAGEGQSCDQVKQGPGSARILLRNDGFCRDVSQRFDDRGSSHWPITAPRLATWLAGAGRHGDVINLVWDYAIFGQTYEVESGIFDFLKHLPDKVLAEPDLEWATCGQVVRALAPAGVYRPAEFHCRSEQGGDLSAWLGTPMQSHAATRLFALLRRIRAVGDLSLLAACRELQPCEYFHGMDTQRWEAGSGACIWGPGDSPYDVFINFMNILDRLEVRAAGGVDTRRVRDSRGGGPNSEHRAPAG